MTLPHVGSHYLPVILHLGGRPCQISRLPVLPLCGPCLGGILLRSRGCGFSVITRRHYLPAGFPVLRALTVAPPPLPLWLRCRGCVMNVSAGAGHPTINSSLHFDQLWLSIMIHLLIMFIEPLMTNFAFVVLIIISLLQTPCYLGCCHLLLA